VDIRIYFLAVKGFEHNYATIIDQLELDSNITTVLVFEFSKIVLDDIHPQNSLIVTCHSLVPWINESIVKCRKLGVKSIGLQDGVIEYAHSWGKRRSNFRYRPVLTDKIGVFGQFSKDILVSWGCPEERIFITGRPAMQSFECLFNNTVQGSEEYDFLIAPANAPFYDAYQEKNFIDGINDLCDFLKARQYTFLLRIKKKLFPLFHDSLHQYFQDSSSRQGIEFTIINSKAVITTPSTVILDSFYLQKPTAILNYNNESLYLNSPWNISHKDQLEAVIEEMKCPPQSKIELQNLHLKYHLDTNSPTKVFCNQVYGMLNRTP
jgi:hypothetical protein